MSSPALSPNGHFVYIGSYVLSLFPSATAAALLLLLLLLSSPVGIVLWRLWRALLAYLPCVSVPAAVPARLTPVC